MEVDHSQIAVPVAADDGATMAGSVLKEVMKPS